MGKTFVEDERPCDSCVNVTRYGCVSWNCEYINRDEAIKAWREKHEMADRKTESSSEKPNNCDTCRNKGFEGCEQPCLGCGCCGLYEPKDEPQKTTDYCDVCNHKGCDNCVADGSNPYCVPSNYEPKDEQTDCQWK